MNFYNPNLKRIEDMGVKFVPECKVNAEKFAEIRSNSDAVVVSTGGHKIPFL